MIGELRRLHRHIWIAWLVVVVQDAPTRYAGLAWLTAGFIFYVFYRRRLGFARD